ncbi:MAG: thioredoxin [Dehalococcoidia bacterium]
MAKPFEVADGTFDQEVLQSSVPVLVDFWAPWCGPCRMVAPIVEELAQEYDGRALFTKVNVDDSPGVAVKYGIRSIPTVLFFKEGKAVDQVVGAVPKKELQKHLEAVLG